MIAPRAVVALGNPPFKWLGDESGFKSMVAASRVFGAMELDGNLGYDFADGHNHCAATPRQAQTVGAFVNRFLQNGNADTNVCIAPNAGAFSTNNVDLNADNAIDWDAPELR